MSVMKRHGSLRSGAALLATSLCLVLSGCESFDPSNLLPDTKKPLPGERRLVFPEGVPGVTQGVPPELMRGSQQQDALAATPPPQPAPEEKPRPKAKAKKKAPSQQSAEETPEQQPAQRTQPARGPQPAQAQQASPWPAPPQTGTFSR
jgi:outer membrane biosynthesis protein TonB